MGVGTAPRRGAALLASTLRIIGTAIALVLVLHVALTLLEANPANQLTIFVADLAVRFNLGLADLFLPADPKLAVALNYGLAALVWFAVTAVVVRIVRRFA
ncbi:hypothetical protein [Pseudonocardia asaccharolytica]|uniref:YggT family protein n=1 Tax=Pseudonocardia asaccharolytica DSM 44247 = NBRC 16224 TaxID=1123024 RepID=A0A511D313_9PSEU|nr:hypothetical protein [Pseudonocardia asaccharolytica]GEL19172.1 hypothetical protein PA7_30090 [Pseudonocardia asaccharolytica DSM 44247 = NBRC 16224]